MTKNQHRLRAEQYADTRAGAILQSNGDASTGQKPILAPCKRCGGEGQIVQTARGSDRSVYIECKRCGRQTAPVLLHWLADPERAIASAAKEWSI